MCTGLSRGHTTGSRADLLPRVLRAVIIPITFSASLSANAQSLLNGAFSSGTTGWNSCQNDIGISWLYGGGSLTDKVASINGGLLPGLGDDNMLCQTITALIPGTIYRLSFQATRSPVVLTPSTVSVSVVVDGNAVEAVVTRTGGWNMTTTNLSFTATSTSHTLTISPNFQGLLGMIIDNISVSVVSPLPISLLYFDATEGTDAVQLAWATASEQDNAAFAVERSADLREWATVAEMPGAGNSQEVLTYAAADRSPLPGMAYYRLRQTDLDGHSTVSEARSVFFSAAQRMLAMPNPAHDGFALSVPAGEAGPFQVFDPLGRCITRLSAGPDGKWAGTAAGWAPGAYRIRSEATGRSVALAVE